VLTYILYKLIYKYIMYQSNKTFLCLLLFRAAYFDSYAVIFRPF